MPVTPRLDRYLFGRFELHPDERRLVAGGVITPLTPRTFDLLVALVERAGALVSKDELLERVWPGLVVEENNLQVQISALRKVVGHSAIETVPGHGYRFLPKVATVDVVKTSPRDGRRHNLPRQLTSFIGHECDLETCGRLLDTTRLLTLTGFGGLGKTRLSLEIAGGRLDEYADGVWFVELAPLADGRLVSQTVASALGVTNQADRPLLEILMKFVSDRRLLLIMDNCEHLLHACADIARQLLQAGPDVKILASSREPLHVPGETTYPLSSLSFPDSHRNIAIEALAHFESVRLFVDRATAAYPDFRLTKVHANAVCEICARLDGIPLALELAAARVRVMSVEAIAQRLNDRFRLLKGGDQTALPHQQTLRATIDWSYDLLAAQERILLHRLAVFSGGWDLEAAEAVGRGGEIEASDVVSLNGQLTEKSLVVAEREGTRYRLLETVRQYAQERLDASGEGDATRTRHLDFYLALAEEAESNLLGPLEGSCHAQLDLERENLLSALLWCERTEERAEAALRLVFALRRWLCRGYVELGCPVMEETLGRARVQQRNLCRCRGLFAAGFLSYFIGRYEDARRYGTESLAIALEIDAIVRVADALIMIGSACHGQDDRLAARRHLVEGLARAREAGDIVVLVEALNCMAELQSTEDELDAAEALYEEALVFAHELGSRDLTAIILLNRARNSISRGSMERAGGLLREVLVLFAETGSTRNAHMLLAITAGLAAFRGEWERAAMFYGAAGRQLEQMGLRREPADEFSLAPLIARAREASGATSFAVSEAAGRARSCDGALAEARTWVEGLA